MNRRQYQIWKQRREEALKGRRAAVPSPVAPRLPATVDVAAIRLALPGNPHPITQDAFARRFGFSAAAVRDWEQGRRKPEGAARLVLALIRHDARRLEAAIHDALAVVPVEAPVAGE